MTNNEYWEKRTQKAKDRITDRGIQKVGREIGRQYKKTANKLIEQFLEVYKQIELMRGRGEEPTANMLYKMDKYWSLLDQVREELRRLGGEEYQSMYKNFQTEYKDIYNAIHIKGRPEYNTLSEKSMERTIEGIWCSDGKEWSARIWENNSKLARMLEEEIAFCVSTGKKPSYLKKALMDKFNVSYSMANTIVRTEMAHIENGAAKQRYKDYGVEYVKIWAKPDERRCTKCGSYHEKQYRIDEAPQVPFHPNCRCAIVPVLDD